MTLPDLDITVTVVFNVKGSDYDPSDWDNDPAVFRAGMEKEAVNGIRNDRVDIADRWLEVKTDAAA